MPVIIDQLESVIEAPSSPTPAQPAGERESAAPPRADLARTLRRIARREARLAAD